MNIDFLPVFIPHTYQYVLQDVVPMRRRGEATTNYFSLAMTSSVKV